MGTMHSIPISSAICASRRLFSQLASQRSGSVAYVLPLEQLAPKSPSLRLLPFTRTALRCRIRASPPRRSTSRTPRRRKDSPFTRCLRGRRLDCIRFRFHPASETRAVSSICLARPDSLGYVQNSRTKGGPPGHGQCRPSIEPLLLISHSFGVICARFRTSHRRSRPDRRAQATTARPRPRSHPRQTLQPPHPEALCRVDPSLHLLPLQVPPRRHGAPEVTRFLSSSRLMAFLLYGAGLRLLEC